MTDKFSLPKLSLISHEIDIEMPKAVSMTLCVNLISRSYKNFASENSNLRADSLK